MSQKAKKQTYVKKDPISHVLDRPDTWVGSVRSRKVEEFVVVDDQFHISRKTIDISPAIIRMFVEPLSNVIDNVARSRQNKNPTTKICIDIDQETGKVSFWNDGDIVPVEQHDEEKCYNHTMIFGQMLTGSNYDDNEEREDISGRNGIGIKSCNIFSKIFTVEGADPDNKKLFRQTWKNNMRSPSDPVITAYKNKKGYTKISYVLDFERFGVQGYTDDILSLYRRLVVDTAMITKVPVFLNDEEVPVNSLSDYAKLYSNEDKDTLTIKTKDCEVVITPSSHHDFQAISFANGIYTPLGGTHVEAWSEAIFRPLVDKLNKPKKPQVNIGEVKKYFRLFVVCTVKNPEFDTQSKTKLEAPQVEAEVKKTHIATISKWPVMEMLEDIIRAKEMVVLKKAERKKRGHERVEGLEPANFEGGPKAHECTLILVEGLSAKTYASWGIQKGVFGKKGRDFMGIYPLRGKILNCRNAKPLTVSKNAVITDIIKALNIQYGLDYSIDENYKKLRYGRLLIIVDADTDGNHISGLIQNMFHALFPTLLNRNPPFITAMQTPIVRVYQGKSDILFYDEDEYRKYVQDNPNKKINKKYYKGLGSSNQDDVIETFGQKIIEFVEDDHTFENMNKAFHTKYSDSRKDWLEQYDPTKKVLKWNGNKEEKLTISYSDYINTELIKFSLEDCRRSIPSLMDGIKEGHRKVLYVTLLRNLKYSGKSIKVAQLAGSVSEKANYHHGEKNLELTITGMANSYVGSNNIPLLFRDGQFGSRAEGGKDAAAGRYIWTKLDAMTRLIFKEDDDRLLEYIEDDGDKIEPKFYAPIIPMILCNGCFEPETEIPLFNGTIKKAKDIVIGDILIGDDGTNRRVLELYNGLDQMYEIQQKYGNSYTVNSKHILVLKLTGDRSIFWSNNRNAWKTEWFCNETQTVKSKFMQVEADDNKENIYKLMQNFIQTLPVADYAKITVENYLQLPKSIQIRLRGCFNEIAVEWPEKSVAIDPYILGLWIGDGDSHGRGFTNIDRSVIEHMTQWCQENKMSVKQSTGDKYHYYMKMTEKPTNKKGILCHPFKKMLAMYNLIENKHIPDDYVYNSIKVRLALLAGIIDTDGCVYGKGGQIAITQCLAREHIIDKIIIIGKSLGFCCRKRKCEQTLTVNGITKKYPQIKVNISGKGIENIPTLIDRKKCISRREDQRDCMTNPITVIEKGIGKYCGWSVDRNRRFLLTDFTIAHNCVAGIGTGWSSSVPAYNPLDLVVAIKAWLNNSNKAFDTTDGVTISLLPDLKPWYRGHTGEMTSEGDGKYTSWGKIERDKNKVVVTELPVGLWTSDFVEVLEKMKEDKQISNYKNHSTPTTISFTITESKDGIQCDLTNLKLSRSIRTSNMVLFTEQGKLKKFASVDEIIDEFCQIRYSYYVKRKSRKLKELEREIKILGNKKRFLEEVRDGVFKLFEEKGNKKQSRKATDVIKDLEKKGYDKDLQEEEQDEDGMEQEEQDEDGMEEKKQKPGKHGYEYLLRLQISSITAEKIDKLKDDIANREDEFESLSSTSEKDLWIADLDLFEQEYTKWLPVINNEKKATKKAKK